MQAVMIYASQMNAPLVPSSHIFRFDCKETNYRLVRSMSCLVNTSAIVLITVTNYILEGGAKCLQIASLVLIALTIRFNCH